jgi:hypothetical protein
MTVAENHERGWKKFQPRFLLKILEPVVFLNFFNFEHFVRQV